MGRDERNQILESTRILNLALTQMGGSEEPCALLKHGNNMEGPE